MPVVRPADSYDCGVLASLHLACFDESWDVKAFQKLLKEKETSALLVKEGVRPVGFVVFRVVAGESEILTFGVVGMYRRKGIGKALMSEMFRAVQAKRARSIFLEVRDDNVAALGFYDALGFQEMGRRKDYYTLASGKKRDAVTMRCDVSD